MKIENDIKPQFNIKQIQRKNNQNGLTVTPAKTQSFTGFSPVPLLNFLDTNQAWGACAVDLGFMVIPRTATDFGRGADAGFETMRREGLGTTNHSCVGLYGTAAGMALAAALNHTYGLGKGSIKAHSIFADTETLDMQGKIFTEAIKKPNPLEEHLTQVLSRYQVQTADGSWKGFGADEIKKAAQILENEIRTGGKKISKEADYNVRSILRSSVEGIGNNFRIISEDGAKQHTSRYSIDYIVENAYKLTKIFIKDKVKETFENTADYAQNAFLKSIKTMNKNRSLVGIGIASAVGVSAQPLNMYITKKKTGNTGFVGGGEEDKSAKFKAKKAVFATLFGAGVLSTIENPLKLIKNPKLLGDALLFKGFSPTIKQFKFIYGITIMSRFLASRNDNELKESTIKDTLGFANWLILGNFVQKLVAQGLDKTLVKRDGRGIVNWLKNSTLKTREEVLHSALGKKAFKNGKALSLMEMIKELPKGHAARKQLGFLTLAQLAGYAYSGIVLGTGIPKLNIYLTKRRMAKQNAQQQDNATANDNKQAVAYAKSLNNFTGYKMIHQ